MLRGAMLCTISGLVCCENGTRASGTGSRTVTRTRATGNVYGGSCINLKKRTNDLGTSTLAEKLQWMDDYLEYTKERRVKTFVKEFRL